MSGVTQRWTPEAIQTARAILGRHERLEPAFDEIGRAVGFRITRHSIDSAFNDAGVPTPFRHLRRPGIPPVNERDTERMRVAPIIPPPDDSRTTAPELPVTGIDLAAHRQRNRIADLEARNKRLLEELAQKDDELSNLKDLSRTPRPIEAPARKGGAQRKGVPVMLCSDWHVGEEVDPAKVNGLNEYNIQIAERCIDRMADGFEWMLRDTRFDCRTAVIALMGDLMTGYIHPELVESNLLSPQEEQVFLLDHLEMMFRKILATTQLEKIVVPCLSGNHGRATDKQRVATREANSHEQVVYQTLRRLFRDEPRLEFHIAGGEWIELDVMGFKHAFTHGDSFNYQGGVGGISIPIRRGVSRQFQGQRIHQFCMGHFHQRQDFGDIQINGSLIGYSSYSQRIHAAFEARQQHWFLVDSERGKSLSAPLWI